MQSVEPLKTRREFFQDMAFVTGAITAGISSPAFGRKNCSNPKVTLFALSDASDSALQQPPVRWALGQLRDALHAKGFVVGIRYNLEKIHEPGERILVTPCESRLAHRIAGHAGVTLPSKAESLALIPGSVYNQAVLMVTGADSRGMVYGLPIH